MKNIYEKGIYEYQTNIFSNFIYTAHFQTTDVLYKNNNIKIIQQNKYNLIKS